MVGGEGRLVGGHATKLPTLITYVYTCGCPIECRMLDLRVKGRPRMRHCVMSDAGKAKPTLDYVHPQ